MRTCIRITLTLALALAGCDDGSGTDAGPNPGTDAGPRRDGGGGGTDGGGDAGGGGGTDAGGTDAGMVTDPCAGSGPPALDVESIGSFNRPVFVAHAPGEPGVLYIVESAGRIQRRDASGTVNQFLQVTTSCSCGGGDERGLLGLAFHPDYATNGRFFIYRTTSGGGGAKNRVEEYARSAGDPTVADATMVARLVDQDDFADNHNGGMIGFGPDGFLYVGMGDGGGGGDPQMNGLNTNTFLGSLLRLDVDNMAGGYAAAGNPFEAGGGAPQLWAYGLRNPWRWSFDRVTGDLWIADVGQNQYEEINFQPASSTGGENYGWRAYEGLHEYSGATAGDLAMATNHTDPIYEYDHSVGISITGGYVYRGSAIPELQGYYLFSDYQRSTIEALRQCPGGVDVQTALSPADTGVTQVVGFGEDENGEIYVVGLGGQVVRIIAAP
ncbi:MAG: sorbosone dehydrogenase family protein [Sandaracinaceae bacterium]